MATVNVEWAVAFSPVCPSKPFTLPRRHHDGDAGYDLYTSQRVHIGPGRWANVPTNLRVAPPPGTWSLIIGRSSTLSKRGLLVHPGIIDNGFRGELFANVYNPRRWRSVWIEPGERLVQLIIFNLVTPDSIITNYLPQGDRGERGFGSTGA